jgi:type I restriction enzyme S subunit
MNRTLEQMAQAIFKSWFIDFDPVRAKAEGRDPGLPKEIADLFPNSFEDSELGPIPKGWRATTIGSEFDLTMGQSPPGSTYNEEGEGLPFFQGRRDFGFRYPSNRVYCTAPTRIAHAGDTLVSVRAPVGDINMAYETCCVGRGVAAVRHKSGSRSYTYYAMLALGERFKSYEAEGTVFGAINKKQFQNLPSIAPQPDIVSSFEKLTYPLDENIRSFEEEIRTLSETRDTLLPKLISGELRVPDAEKLVEAAI